MINVNQITSQLAKMPDPMLQKYAAMHKDDPYTVALALSESNRRKAMRVGANPMPGEQPKVVDQDIAEMAAPTQQIPQQAPQQMPQQQLPENVGIGQLPAPNMQRMADGGIVGYADKGTVESDPKQVFATEYRPIAEKVGARLGVDPGILIAQWGHESGWGRKTVGQYNFGNIKDVTGKGPRAHDKIEGSRSSYKSYESPDQFAEDYTKLIEKNFPKAINSGKDVSAFTAGLKEGVSGPYATDKKYPEKLLKTYTDLFPAATAAPTAAPAVVAPAGTNEIPQAVDFSKPAQRVEAPVAPRSQWQAMLDAGRGIVGAGETALQYGTGMLAIPTAGVASLLGSKTTPEAEAKYRKYADEVTYQPRTEAGQNISESTRRVLDDLKVPPILAHMGNLSPKAGRTGIAAAELEGLANRLTKEMQLQRLAGPTTSETMVQGQGQPPVRQAPASRQYQTDMENAAAFRDLARSGEASKNIPGTLPEVLERNAQLSRAQAVAAGSSPAGGAGLTALNQNQPDKGLPMGDLGYDPSGLEALNSAARSEKGALDGAISTAAKDAGVKPSKFKDDMALMFFLNLMGGKSPNPLTNVSTSGIGALKYGQELKKEESEQLYREALGKKYGTPSEIQMLEYLKDPKNMANYMQQREAMREPMTKEALYKLFMASPQAMAEPDPEKLGKSFQNFVSTYENQFGPIGAKLPAGVKVSRAGT